MIITDVQLAVKEHHVHEAALDCGAYGVAVKIMDSCTTQFDMQNST
jgi:hypothetical protein